MALAEVERIYEQAPGAAYPGPDTQLFMDGDEKLDFIAAPDLKKIGQRLIRDYKEFAHLRELTVVFLWKREGGEKQGQSKLAYCYKPNGMVKHFSGAEWVIWVAADHCEAHELTRQQIESLLHHELCHASFKLDKAENVKPAVAGHDWDGFTANIKRYGLWQENLKLAAQAFAQVPMFGEV